MISKARNEYLWRGTYQQLLKKGFMDPDLSTKFARAQLVLSGYTGILSDEGRSLLDKSRIVMENIDPVNPISESEKQAYHEVIDRAPTVNNPHLELFVSPSERLSQSERDKLKKKVDSMSFVNMKVIQVSSGCANHCTMCGLDAPFRMVHMPYPMVLALAKEFFGFDSRVMTYFDSDPLNYRDVYFDADYGDIANELRSEIYKIGELSHGWWDGDQFAQAAAEKMYNAEVQIDAFSIHLFHSQIIDNLNNKHELDHQIESFFERFDRALKLLRPISIRLIGGRDSAFPKELSLSFISDLYDKHFKGNLTSKHKVETGYVTNQGRGKNLLDTYGWNPEQSSIDSVGEHVIFKPSGEVKIINVSRKIFGRFRIRERVLHDRLFDGPVLRD